MSQPNCFGRRYPPSSVGCLHNRQCKSNHMPVRRAAWCKQHKPTVASRHNQPAGRLLSRLSFHMANHATANTSTTRCANVDSLPIAAIKPTSCSICNVPIKPRSCYGQSMPRFPCQAKQCLRPQSKPHVVGACIQKRFDAELEYLLPRVSVSENISH